METLQPTLKRGRDVWDPIRMPESEFQKRVDKIQKELQKRHINALLLYGNGQNDYGHPCYITHYLTKMPQGAMAVITDKGEVALICEGFARDAALIRTTTWVKDIRSAEDLCQKSVEYLKEKKLLSSTIGFAGFRQFMPYRQFHILTETTRRCRVVDADDLIERMRMVKSERESDQIRRSAHIINLAFDLISHASFSASGLNERILEAGVGRLAYLEGAEDVRILIGKPKASNWTLRPPEDTRVADGDTLILYLAVELERYWAEGTRTFTAKGPTLTRPESADAESLYERVVKGLNTGKSVSSFYKETLGKIKRGKIDSLTEYGLGGGIGISLQEPPQLIGEDKTLLKEGMCLTLRLAVKDRELGAFMIGNTLHLSKNGPEVLTKDEAPVSTARP
jgi:Xaa-Pro aminopeptidase